MENTGADLFVPLILNGKYMRVISRLERKVAERKTENNAASG
jgi:hypothetical protein